MADPVTTQTYNPQTGQVEDIDQAALSRAAEATGAHELSQQEAWAYQQQQAEQAKRNDLAGAYQAEVVGKVRGIGEAFGVPVDQIATALGGADARSYLEDLKRYHPYASGWGDLSGQVFGGLATGGGATAEQAGAGALRRYGGAAARGALENMVIGATSDVNEAALGNPNEAAEKILANLPAHAALGAVGGAVGHGIGEGVSALLSKGTSAVESGLRAGSERLGDAELRKALGGSATGDIVGELERRQAAFRAQSAAAHAAEREGLLGRQQGELFRQGAEHEGEQLALAKRSQITLDEVAAKNAKREAEILSEGVTAKDTLLGKQAEEKARQFGKNVTAEQTRSVDQDWARIAHQGEVDGAIKELAGQHDIARKALQEQAKEAVETATKLGAERDAMRNQVKNLAGELDKVKGAELPNASNILGNVEKDFGLSPLNPASDNAIGIFNEWQAKFAKKPNLTFSELQDAVHSLDELEKRTRVFSGTGKDPEVSRAIDSFRNAAKAEFDRASEATANSVSEARNLSASRLREMYPQAQKAYREALDHANSVQGLAESFETQAAKETRIAQAEAKKSMERLESRLSSEATQEAKAGKKAVRDLSAEHEGELAAAERETDKAVAAHKVEAKAAEKDAERAADRELSQLERKQDRARSEVEGRHKEELKALGKPSKETPVDTLLRRYKRPEPETGGPSKLLGLGSAMLSLLHGNVASAAMSALRELGGGAARGSGNLAASSALRSLADHLAAIDKDVFSIAGKVTGRYARQGADQDVKAAPARSVSFEKASAQVLQAQTNPLILENKVRQAAGPWAKDAPGVYAALLEAAQRQQAFLASKLPPPRVDPLSPTPQLGGEEISDTEKYEFLQYFKASNDPIGAMRDVVSGHGTSLQVEAVQEVYPGIYKQAQTEVARQLAEAKKPLTWDQSVNLATLMGADTSQLMTGEFQSGQAAMYQAREEGEDIKGGSAPSRKSNDIVSGLQSAGQSIQENL